MSAKTGKVNPFEGFSLNEPEDDTPVIEKMPTSSTKRTVVYMPTEAFEILREVAHKDRISVNDLLVQGIDHVLTTRHYPTCASFKAKRKK